MILGEAQLNQPGGEAAIEGIIADDDRRQIRPWHRRGGQYREQRYLEVRSDRVRGLQVRHATTSSTASPWAASAAEPTIDYVMVHQPLDDGFEWFGGTVNASHLVVNDTAPAPGGGDDIYDCDFGFVGQDHEFLRPQEPRQLRRPERVRVGQLGQGRGLTRPDEPHLREGHALRPRPHRAPRAAPTAPCSAVALRARSTASCGAAGSSRSTCAIRARHRPHGGRRDELDRRGGNRDQQRRPRLPASTRRRGSPAAPATATANPGFTADDCFAAPTSAEFKKVMDSDKGAFEGDTKWMEGAWLDWSDN